MAKPKIGIFTTLMDRRIGMGTAVGIRGFVDHLERYRDEFDFTLIHKEAIPEDPTYGRFPEIIIKQLRLPKYRGFFSELWFYLTCRQKFDILYNPYSKLHPLFWMSPARRHVVLLGDGGARSAGPEVVAVDKIKPWMKPLLRRIDAVSACSNFGRDGIIQSYGIDPAKVFVAYWAADERFTELPNRDGLAAELEQKFGLKRPFILGSGRLDPHKNILRLVEAYAELLESYGIEENLVVVGGRHIPDYSAKVDQLIADRGLQSRVTIVRIPKDEDMPKLYNVARCLVFPSLYEAFGMPLIEAMKCGIPTVTARSSAFPEVGGDATEYVDPYSSSDIARGIHRVLSDRAYADELVQRGRTWSQQFSWDRHVASTVEVFRKLLIS